MKNKRPVNLELTKMKFPPTAISSILHRISGFFLFLFIPFVLWVLSVSLASQSGFDKVHYIMNSAWMMLLVWIFTAFLLFHLVAGIRHLLMDLHLGEGKTSGRVGAYLAMFIALVLIVLAGVWLW